MMRNRIGECCVFASFYNLIVVRAAIANNFLIGVIDPPWRSYFDL